VEGRGRRARARAGRRLLHRGRDILETRRLADGLVLGYLGVDFSFTDKATLSVHLGVVATRTAGGWQLTHYQVSYLA
jgi:hypothetical protein